MSIKIKCILFVIILLLFIEINNNVYEGGEPLHSMDQYGVEMNTRYRYKMSDNYDDIAGSELSLINEANNILGIK